MTKKFLTIILSFVLLLSSVSVVFAAKIEEDKDVTNENIYALWGDFEHQNCLFKVKQRTAARSKWVEGGALGTEHCIELTAPQYISGDLLIDFIGVIGESYDFSFYIKSAQLTPASLTVIYSHLEGGWTTTTTHNITQEWTKVSFTVDCTNKNGQGTTVSGIEGLIIRFNGGTSNDKLYIDQLEAYPHGKVEADYSYLNTNFYGITSDPQAPERAIEAQNVEFSDVKNHWGKGAIESLAKYDYIEGIGDGLYSPDTSVTRAQFLKMVSDLYKIRVPEYDGSFTDISGDEWYTDPIFKAEKLGLINDAMKENGKIYPDQAITREEVATVAAIVAKDRGAKGGATLNFADQSQISNWAKDGVKNAASFGMIAGYEDGTFKPKNNITRAEAAQILFRLVEISSRMGIYVDAKIGSDDAEGTKDAPLKTIEAARDMAAKYAPTMRNDITIYIRGEQYLENTFELNENHSGNNGYNIIYTSWGDEKATLTMAKEYRGFTLHDAKKNIWKTNVGVGTYTRQAYFNDVKGIRSRSIGYLDNVERIDESKRYFLCDNTELLSYKYPLEMEMVFHSLWTHNRFDIVSLTEENGRVKLVPSDIFNTWDLLTAEQSVPERAFPAYLENAYELLDEKGEWYLNQHDGYIYYIPRNGEDMSTMTCKLPLGEEMIIAAGSDYDKPLTNVIFDNIVFEGTTWLFPDENDGFFSVQANYICEPVTKVRDSYGAIHFEKCQNIKITNNIFRQLGYTGLEFINGSRNIDIIGNEFYDISSTSMVIDDFRVYISSLNPSGGGRPQNRELETWCDYINITNNYIHDVGRDYNGAAGVTLGHPRHTKFSHNEISNIAYSGMHVGWGWGGYANTGSLMYDLEISYNYIHDVMNGRSNDGAHIYTIGASSLECDKTNTAKNNRIIGNYLANGWSCTYVYPDEGSTSWYIKDNVCDDTLVKELEYNFDRAEVPKSGHNWSFMHARSIMWITTENNYSDVDYSKTLMNGRECVIEPTNIVKDGNWPDEAKAIMNNAGIEAEYRDNFNLDTAKVLACDNKWATLPLETPTESGLMILGHHNKKYPLSDYNIDFWVEDDAVTLDVETGMVTAHKSGVYEAEVVATINGVMQQYHMIFNCGTEIEKITIGASEVELINGFQSGVTITGLTSYGKQFDITEEAEVDVKSLDENIATIEKSEDGKKLIMTGVVGGETRFVGTVKYQGKMFELDVPVNVRGVKFGSEEALTLPYTAVDLRKGWKNDGIEQEDGGTKVGGSPNHYQKEFSNELIAFDMVIDAGSTWPTLALCDSNIMGDYSTNNCYMYGFKEDHIEIQKFNGGTRTMFFGNGYAPIAGPGVPNLEGGKIYEYGERISVVMGALNTSAGTRLILTINGKNIIDYTDTTANKIAAKGYMVIYNPTPGGMTFYPFSDIKAE